MYNIHNDTCFELQIVQTSCLTVALWCTFLYLKIIACIMVIDTTLAYLIPYIRHVKQGDLDPSVRGLRPPATQCYTSWPGAEYVKCTMSLFLSQAKIFHQNINTDTLIVDSRQRVMW